MIKIKFISLIILLYSFLTVSSFSCNYRIIDFEAKPNDIKLETIPFAFSDPFGGKTIIIPIDNICPNETDILGTTIHLLFLNDKMVSIKLERSNMNDKKLMDLSSKEFGSFDIPKNIDKKNWRGSHTWNNPNEYIEYYSFDKRYSGEMEVLRILPKKYFDQLKEYEQKIEEWLSSKK